MSPREFADLFASTPAYEPMTEAEATGDPVPVIRYVKATGEVLETRDYNSVLANPDTDPRVRFRIESSRPEQVVVVARIPVDGQYLPAVAIYYDALSSLIRMESNGTVPEPPPPPPGGRVSAVVTLRDQSTVTLVEP